MADKYIQNTHNAPIKCNARDENGKVLFTKKFMPYITEKWTGKVLSTGYEKVTEEEYGQLAKSSSTFRHFSQDLKLLVVHDDMPADLKTPHEALVDARKDARKAAAKIAALEAENESYKAKLFDTEAKYKELSSASADVEKLKSLKKVYSELVALGNEFAAKVANLAGNDKKVKDLVDSHLAKIGELAVQLQEKRDFE